MDYLSKYTDCLSKFRLEFLSGPQNLLMLGLGAVGGFYILSQVLTFVGVLLSLFVLPGKSVSGILAPRFSYNC
jgi:17beta-estradiol 17-dehydrogenase / very-long-chain 3-oxoacyl-CoA reductase